MQDTPQRGQSGPRAGLALTAGDPPGSGPRIAIEGVAPELDGGHFPIKRLIGDRLTVEADIFSDGHETLGAALLVRAPRALWTELPMRPLGNDRWAASLMLTEIGTWHYTILAWRDPLQTWLLDIGKKRSAGQPLEPELLEGVTLLRAARDRLASDQRGEIDRVLEAVDPAAGGELDAVQRLAMLQQPAMQALLTALRYRSDQTRYPVELEVWVDRKRAAFSAWYELMPRSQARVPGRHGTFDDVIARLPDLRDLGFDVLYLTPIHPIGRINRKGRNNALKAEPGDPGSPYAIGAHEGGHDAIHPELGSFQDFARLVAAAREYGLEIALDFAIQCAPDHPWIRDHPEWFQWRPDGSIRFAENPPKKYEDIVNVSFYGDAYPALWYALRDVLFFWIDKGVSIFRVDNPHTKPFPFWQWLIRQVRDGHPEVIFLSEAFTRPKVMRRLAKLGFTQSYSYFTWRNTKTELTEYLTELTGGPSRDYMRPNFFANTPDINPYYLQSSGRPGFQVRLFLAATLGGNYGIYSGFELCEATPIAGKEEYLNSEKYELKMWDWERLGHIREDIRRLNALRRSSPALQSFSNLTFYNAWNDHILYYGKSTPDRRDFLLFAVNLDPHHPQGAHFEVPLWEFGLPDHASIEAEDLVIGRRFTWTGKVQHMWLDPNDRPYMVWRLYDPVGARGG
jgi:starch synthase (maltosyl-transferring)